jgi:hypothetical protein
MRSVRKKSLVLAVTSATVVLGMVGVARATFGPGENFGFVWTEYGSAESQETVQLVGHMGKALVTQRYIIPHGFDGLWPTLPGPNVNMMIKGAALKTYEGCGGDEKVWEVGKSYYRDGAASPQGMRVVNNGSADTELVVVWLDVNPAEPQNSIPWGSQERVSGACAKPAPFGHYEYARGPAYTDIPWSHEKGTMVVAMDFLTSPQWHLNWHTHPPTFITHLRGTEREFIGCPEIIDWQPNITYLHSPNNFGRPQERAKNMSNTEANQFWVMFTKAPKERFRGQIPVTFTGPPNGCVTDGFTTNTSG